MDKVKAAQDIEVDIKFIVNPEMIIAAMETADELGCVLRVHLVYESLLEFYLDQKVVGDVTVYLRKPREYGAKVGLSVAFGLPLSFAAVFKHLNDLRNKLAHGKQSAVRNGDVKGLVRLVNHVLEEQHASEPKVEQRFLALQNDGMQQRAFGSAGDMLDFRIAAMSFWQLAANRLVSEAVMQRMASGRYKADESTD